MEELIIFISVAHKHVTTGISTSTIENGAFIGKLF